MTNNDTIPSSVFLSCAIKMLLIFLVPQTVDVGYSLGAGVDGADAAHIEKKLAFLSFKVLF